jgi:hypothetical protein
METPASQPPTSVARESSTPPAAADTSAANRTDQ